MAAALAGTAPDQAVFRDHQGHAAIDQHFAGDAFADVADLGQGHLKAQGHGSKFHIPCHQQRTGVIDVQAEVAAQTHICLPDGDHLADVADQRIPDALRAKVLQILGQLFHLIIMDDTGQDCGHIAPLGQFLAQVVVFQQDMHGDVEHGGLGLQEAAGDLLPGGDLNGQRGMAGDTLTLAGGDGLAQTGHIVTGTKGGELIQGIPAHGVDGGGGEGQLLAHLGLHLHAAVGGAAGLRQTLGQDLLIQRKAQGLLRIGTFHFHGTAIGVGDLQEAALHRDAGIEGDIHQLVFHTFVALTGGSSPLGVFPLVGADAEHVLADLAGIVAVGKALAVEGGMEFLLHIGCHHALINGVTVNSGDGSHVFGLLHAAFQLQGGHTHALQFLQVMDQAVILQAQGVLVLKAAIAVALAAGLGTAATVAGAAADGGRQVALTGVAHAQGTVGKDFDLNGGVGADVGDLLLAQLSAQDHAAHTQSGTDLDTGQRVDGELGGAVNGHAGGDLTAQPHYAQVLNDEGIHAGQGGLTDQLFQFGGLLVGNQGVQSQVNGNAADMAVLDCFGQGLQGKILGALTRIKNANAQIDRIGTVLNGGLQRFHGAGRG